MQVNAGGRTFLDIAVDEAKKKEIWVGDEEVIQLSFVPHSPWV